MRGNLRIKNRKQSQKEQLFQEGRFDAGWINDLPASDLPKGGMALLENFVGFPEYIEGRSGSRKFSDTVLPGSGTIFALKQNSTSKKLVLHRGRKIYYADSAMATWTEIAYAGSDYQSLTIAGDTGSQINFISVIGLFSTNSNAGVLYWNLTNSGATRTLNLYSNSGKTVLVASASRVGDGITNVVPANTSGLYGQVQITYTGNDTDAGNTMTGTASYNPNYVRTTDSFGTAVTTDLQEYEGNMLLFGYQEIMLIDLTNLNYYPVNNVAPVYPQIGSGTQSAATPYGYRYLFTWCRILGGVDRIAGTLVLETGSTRNVNGLGVERKDYAESWNALPIDSINTNTLIFTDSGTINASQLAVAALVSGSLTHIGLYRTLDIGVAGTDPVLGTGNNREIYTWVGDFPIGSATVMDAKSDDDLRARYNNNFGLKTRFWDQMQGDTGTVAGSFMYCTYKPRPLHPVPDYYLNRIQYCQLNQREHIGSHLRPFQFFKLNDTPQIIAKSPDMVSFICNNKTYISNPNSYADGGGEAIAPVYVLNHLTVAAENIGVSDWGSFTPMDNAFIAHCSDHTIRIWNSSYWSDDIASRRINQIVRLMLVGSVGIYGSGAYYLFYRTDSGQTNNNLCLRYGFSRETGFGWSKVSGSAWVVPPTYAGAVQMVDANNLQRVVVYDAVDTYSYWIETFTAYTGSSTTKVFKDKVATNGTGGTDITCTARFREFTAPEESLDLFHKESYIYDRPYDEATGYPSGFARILKAYVDGSTTAASAITPTLAKGDLQFFDRVQGNRIQMEVQFTTSGARLTGIGTLCDVFDRAAIGARPSNGVDAASQLGLSTGLAHWVTRPFDTLNRATGTRFTVAGTAPTNVTGPDGRVFALSFITGANYSMADFTTFTSFNAMFWVSGIALNKRVFQLEGPSSFSVFFTSNTVMNVNGVGTVTISSIASGWHHFAVRRTGSTVDVIQNGVLMGSVSVSGVVGGQTFRINPDSGVMTLYDIRFNNVNLAFDAIAYYYADVNTTLQGNKVLPLA